MTDKTEIVREVDVEKLEKAVKCFEYQLEKELDFCYEGGTRDLYDIAKTFYESLTALAPYRKENK